MDIALLSQDVSTHIALIKDKQISAQELATEQYRLIERVNPSISPCFKGFVLASKTILMCKVLLPQRAWQRE